MALSRQDCKQIGNQRSHPAHDLDALSTVSKDFFEAKMEEVVPGRKLRNDPDAACIILKFAYLQPPLPQTRQQIADLVERLHCGGGIIDRRRQSPNCDI